ncbi:MAG: element excision factor XisH family protein [Saprospiraceae bacterium]
MARDKFHYEFRKALESDGWTVTHDPLTFKIGKIQVQIDLGAERLIAAERGEEKIAVEIKTLATCLLSPHFTRQLVNTLYIET